MDLSVVIPLFNEEGSLRELCTQIDNAATTAKLEYEVILVDDGSTDGSWNEIQTISEESSRIKALSFRRNYGKSAALNEGFTRSTGKVVITMDADLQDDPAEIPALYKMIVDDGYHVVSGWKKKRHDPLSKTIPTRLYNRTTRRLTKIRLHDFNCGLKAYSADVIHSLEVYGEMHRYLPVIAKWNGFTKIGEKVVNHRPRKYGKTKFGLERFLNGFLDLDSILFVSRFGKKPMHFFGLFGFLAFLVGFIISLWLIGEKFYARWFHAPYIQRDIVDQPLFYIALLLVAIGVMLFLAGFLGELIHRLEGDKNVYKVRDKLNLD